MARYFVRDVQTGDDLADHLSWIKGSSVSWTLDGAGFFYSRYAAPEEGKEFLAANLNQKLYYHRVGTKQADDELIYERPDQPEWRFSMNVTDDGRYGVLVVRHGTDVRRRIYYKDFGDPENPQLDADVVKLLDDFDAAYSFSRTTVRSGTSEPTWRRPATG